MTGEPMESTLRSVVGALSASTQSDLAELDDADFRIVSAFVPIWRDLQRVDAQERRDLALAWRCAIPHNGEMLNNAWEWIAIAIVDRASFSILRAWLDAQRDPKEYLRGSGPDHLDHDLALGFENHWSQIRDDFFPTYALREAFDEVGFGEIRGVPSSQIKNNPVIWDTFRSAARICAVADTPAASDVWAQVPIPTQESERWRLGDDGRPELVEHDPEFGRSLEWLSRLSARCGCAHTLCAPPALAELLTVATGTASVDVIQHEVTQLEAPVEETVSVPDGESLEGTLLTPRIKAKIVNRGEDLKVRLVSWGEDLEIEPVSHGEVKKVRIVSWGEDKKARLVGNQFFQPGLAIDAGGGQTIRAEKNFWDGDLRLRLPDGTNATLSKDTLGDGWTIRFADGSKGTLTKDLFGDGWTVQTLSGKKYSLTKDYFGGGWKLR